MIYLQENPLLREPLAAAHIKRRLLGHWGTSPGLAFLYVHAGRLAKKLDREMIFVAGPGHGAPGVLAPTYLEETYSEVYPDKGQDADGLAAFLKEFSFPGGVGSHCTPELPGSIHEGGELGYSLSHAYGAAFDNPDLVVVAVVGDGESETGPLATAWHSNKFLNPARDGAVLPVLHLNGYKINNPTIPPASATRNSRTCSRGYGYTPYFVEGSEPATMHQAMAATLEHCLGEIRAHQVAARAGDGRRPRWPMIVLRSTPKGGPAQGVGRPPARRLVAVAPSPDHRRTKDNPAHLKLLESWLRGYRAGRVVHRGGAAAAGPAGRAARRLRRLSAHPSTNGGKVRKSLRMPDFRDYAAPVAAPATGLGESTKRLGQMLRDIIRRNPDNFRLFGPDETASNKLQAVYEASKKTWMAAEFPEDADGAELAPDGRVMEMLSEHTLEGWLEGYLLTGRHGLLSSYEAFVHVIDSMFNQHAKWLSKCNELPWRRRSRR